MGTRRGRSFARGTPSTACPRQREVSDEKEGLGSWAWAGDGRSRTALDLPARKRRCWWTTQDSLTWLGADEGRRCNS